MIIVVVTKIYVLLSANHCCNLEFKK